MKRILFYKYLLIVSILTVFTSCKDGLFNAGEVVTREVLLDDKISLIEVNSMFDITLVQDTINKALTTCGENLQPDIDIFIKDGTLHINNSIKYSWSRDYEKVKLELHLISIPQINVRKPIYMTTRDTFKTNEFFLVDWGKFTELNVTLDVNNCAIAVSSDNFGHFTVKGKAVNATFNGWGSSFIYAEGLQTQNCTVNHRSIGDTYVNVSNTLNVTIETSGKVYYYGNPSTITTNDSLKDKLVHLTN